MSNLKILFSLLIICCIAYAVLLVPSLFYSDKNFSFENHEKITKIIITQDKKTAELLKNSDGAWTVQSKPVSKEIVDNLLYAISRQKVDYPISETQIEQVFSALSDGINVKVFAGNRKKLDFDVCKIDTVCIGLVEKKTRPYALSIPGYSDKIIDYLSGNPAFYLNNTILKYLPSEIETVSVENFEDENKSFEIFNTERNNFMLFDIKHKNFVKTFNKEKIINYLNYFNGVEYDELLNLTPAQEVAIKNKKPMYRVGITTKKDSLYFDVVAIALDKPQEKFGQLQNYDTDNFYLLFNKNKSIAKAKWSKFDIILKELSYFVDN